MKFLYILPGFSDTTKRAPYQKLKKAAERIGYNVMCVEIDWKIALSKQMFYVQENSVVFGFSMGGVAARLLAQKNNVKLLIQASMTPLKYFTDKKLFNDISNAIGMSLTKDIIKNLQKKNKSKKEITMYGEKEENHSASIIVKNTGHKLTDEYINEIIK